MEKEMYTYHIISRYWILVIIFVTDFLILKSFICLFCRNKSVFQISFKFYAEGTLIVFTTKYVTSARYKANSYYQCLFIKNTVCLIKKDIISRVFQANIMPIAT